MELCALGQDPTQFIDINDEAISQTKSHGELTILLNICSLQIIIPLSHFPPNSLQALEKSFNLPQFNRQTMSTTTIAKPEAPQEVSQTIGLTTEYPKPLSTSGALDKFKHDEVTPVIGREYPEVNVVDDIMNAKNSKELIRDLAITSMQHLY